MPRLAEVAYLHGVGARKAAREKVAGDVSSSLLIMECIYMQERERARAWKLPVNGARGRARCVPREKG